MQIVLCNQAASVRLHIRDGGGLTSGASIGLSLSASICLRLRLPGSPRHLQEHTEDVPAGPSAQRATATGDPRAEVKVGPCAQLSEAGL
eukprot:scaffold84966_cov68-Phaeocystis_antarctica.AAC.11